ncbi:MULTISPECIES: Ig-like domain-containing protein [Lachnospiraceae]|nr:Ig-like domain-containing protein [Blautia obeum]
MPSAIYASEDISIEIETDDYEENIIADAELDGCEKSGEIEQQESVNEDAEIALEVNDDTSEINSVGDGDTAIDFSSEEVATEDVGAEVVIPEIKTCNNTSRVTSGTSKTEITRGTDATLNLSVTCMAYVDGKRIDIRAYDNLAIYADIYIDDVKVNDTSIELEKKTLVTASKTYTLTDAVMQMYPEGKEVTVKVYSSLETPANAKLDKVFKLITPAVANPTVEEITPWGDAFEFERGEACSGTIAVKLSDRPVEGKDPYCAAYINGERKTEPVALQRNTNVDPDNGYSGDISIAPELTEYLSEGTKIQIKVGFGSEMEDVSDEKVLEIEATGKPFIQGAKVDEVSVYKDASHEKGLYWVRAGRTYTAYITGKFRNVVEKDPLDVYAGVYVSGKLVGELQKMSVEADNSAYNGTITFTLPDDTPSNPLVGNAVRVKVGIGSEMDNGLSEAIRSGSKLDPNEIKVTDLKVLDGFMEEEVKYIDRQNPQSSINVTMTLEGLPDDLIGTHHEEWLGNQMIDSGLGSPSGMLVGIGKDKAKLLKDYEGTSLTLKIISNIDEEAIFTYEMPIVGLTTKEEETANTVADQLKNLPAVDKIALEDKESVKAARDAYDALNEDQKKLVPEEQVKALTDAETKIAELQKAADKKAADEEAAKAVTDQIAAIPAVKALKLTDASKVKAARDAYNKLSADQKKLVTAAQLKALTDAEARIAQLQKAAQVKPKITLNVTSLPIQVKKSTAGIRIKTTAIKGDKIKSAKSSKSKVVKVSVKNGKLTVKGLKAGKATVTVTSTKGAKATVKIKVQKQKVATKKLKATVSTKQILKKGKKVKLKVAKTPFTAQDTVKWTSSNKKIATVTSKGVVKGLKKGTATITAKAGKKVVRFKIKVK